MQSKLVIVSHFEDSNGDDADYEAKSLNLYNVESSNFVNEAQEVIDAFEGRGYTLDASGDDKTVEWEIADPNPFDSKSKAENAANAVLRALERKLSKYKV
jgi:hypothetical protein